MLLLTLLHLELEVTVMRTFTHHQAPLAPNAHLLHQKWKMWHITTTQWESNSLMLFLVQRNKCLEVGTTLLVTGSNKVKPVPSLKPSKGKSHTGKCSSVYAVEHTVYWLWVSHSYTLLYIHEHTVADKGDDDASLTDDYSNTYSYTGDSGFSDSRAFMKDPPPNLCKQAPATQSEDTPDSDSAYAQLNMAGVHTADYYKSLKRDNIQGTKLTS